MPGDNIPAMGRSHADTFRALRAEVLERLVAIRASIDRAYEGLPDDVIRGQFDVVLGNMASYLDVRDPHRFRDFVKRWAAMRAGEGFAPENVVHAVVAIGDVVRRVAHKRLGMSAETAEFGQAVTFMSGLAARTLVAELADELEQRVAELAVAERP